MHDMFYCVQSNEAFYIFPVNKAVLYGFVLQCSCCLFFFILRHNTSSVINETGYSRHESSALVVCKCHRALLYKCINRLGEMCLAILRGKKRGHKVSIFGVNWTTCTQEVTPGDTLKWHFDVLITVVFNWQVVAWHRLASWYLANCSLEMLSYLTYITQTWKKQTLTILFRLRLQV